MKNVDLRTLCISLPYRSMRILATVGCSHFAAVQILLAQGLPYVHAA